jgi:hypothetical protein
VEQRILNRSPPSPLFPRVMVLIVADEVPQPETVTSPQEKLEKFFERRPSMHELEEKNILKDAKVAPAIQSAKV